MYDALSGMLPSPLAYGQTGAERSSGYATIATTEKGVNGCIASLLVAPLMPDGDAKGQTFYKKITNMTLFEETVRRQNKAPIRMGRSGPVRRDLPWEEGLP